MYRNADGHPVQYDLEGGHRQLWGWDAFGNHLYTSYETSVAPVSAGMRPGRTRRTSLRAYSGDGHVLRGGAGNSVADTLEMLRFAGGYFDADLVPHYYVADYLGSNIAVIRSDGALVQSATYYPYGEPPPATPPPLPSSALQDRNNRRQVPHSPIPISTATRSTSAATACASTSTVLACASHQRLGSLRWTSYANSVRGNRPTYFAVAIRCGMSIRPGWFSQDDQRQ